MDEFNSIKSFSDTYKLKDLSPGKYKIILLKRIQTKFGKSLIIRLEVDDEEKDFYLKKSHANKLSDVAIKKLNAGNSLFHYKGKINDEYYDYKIELN